MENKIIIAGGGPAGMAAALTLHNSGKKFILIEKSNQVGGLAKTHNFNSFKTDNGPHRFFSKNKYLYDLIADLLGQEWIQIPRLTRFYIQGKFYFYPIKISNVFKNLGFIGSLTAFYDYVIQLVSKPFKKKPDNFEDYVVQSFGKKLAELNMINYTEKIWGIPCKDLSLDWASQRIRGLSVLSTIKGSILKSKSSPKSLVNTFYYPANGTGTIYDRILEKIEVENNCLLNTELTEIFWEDGIIKSLSYIKKRQVETIDCDNLVSSIPITNFLKILNPQPKLEVLVAASKLKFRSQVYIFILINKSRITSDNWIYFPDKSIKFARIYEPKNFSEKMSPKGKTSLFVEFFCFEGDDIWHSLKELLLEDICKVLSDKLGWFRRDQIIDSYLLKSPNNYPLYDLNYKKHLNIIKEYLKEFTNLHYIGRSGRFRYTNQDHSLEMGILGAREIIEGKKFNMDNVGSEKDFFEKGYIPKK